MCTSCTIKGYFYQFRWDFYTLACVRVKTRISMCHTQLRKTWQDCKIDYPKFENISNLCLNNIFKEHQNK